jgi:hypothetical protein
MKLSRTAVVFLSMIVTPLAAAADLPVIQVWKSPTCGCCSKWVDHLEASGFTVKVTNVTNISPIKQWNSVPPALGSCHTAVVDGYVVEGHVPAEDIFRLLEDRPAVAGIAVPGMPMGSPGMEGPSPQAYQVMSFDKDGAIEKFSTHEP